MVRWALLDLKLNRWMIIRHRDRIGMLLLLPCLLAPHVTPGSRHVSVRLTVINDAQSYEQVPEAQALDVEPAGF